MGSWNTTAISFPRISRISRSDIVINSLLPSLTLPPTTRPPGGSNRMTDIAVIDLPEPDSPTRPTVSPAPIERETPSTASIVSRRVRMCVRRSRTSSSISYAQPADHRWNGHTRTGPARTATPNHSARPVVRAQVMLQTDAFHKARTGDNSTKRCTPPTAHPTAARFRKPRSAAFGYFGYQNSGVMARDGASGNTPPTLFDTSVS